MLPISYWKTYFKIICDSKVEEIIEVTIYYHHWIYIHLNNIVKYYIIYYEYREHHNYHSYNSPSSLISDMNFQKFKQKIK